ncbi:MAG TPA: recombinase RecA [Thermoplasmata archaeon]|nr:recombinase RecA [Thermoplasmata archaeon]
MAVESPRAWSVPIGSVGSEVFGGPRAEERAPDRIPTGVADFDYLSGGIPAGSVVLLAGEAGAGHVEFALTSAVHLMLYYDDPSLHQFFLGSARGPFVYPKGVSYVSLTRSQDQVMREVAGSFDRTYHDGLARHLSFHDLSPTYFADSVVPSSWASVGGSLLGGGPVTRGPTEPLGALAAAVEADGPSNLVIVDSLTDLLVRRSIDPEALLALVKGLRRRAKQWDGVVYLLLSRGVAPPATEQALYDSVDGVLNFSWTSSPHSSHRQRTMLVERFMPLLARIPHEQQGRFVIRVSAVNGLVTTQYERV